MKVFGHVYTAFVLAPLALAAFLLLSGTANPPGGPGQRPRPDLGPRVFAIEDGGRVRLYRLELDDRPRLVRAGRAVQYRVAPAAR